MALLYGAMQRLSRPACLSPYCSLGREEKAWTDEFMNEVKHKQKSILLGPHSTNHCATGVPALRYAQGSWLECGHCNEVWEHLIPPQCPSQSFLTDQELSCGLLNLWILLSSVFSDRQQLSRISGKKRVFPFAWRSYWADVSPHCYRRTEKLWFPFFMSAC